MDPKSLSNLDPKLRETYERVMGGAASPTTPQAPTAATVPPTIDTAPPAPVTPATPPPPIPTPSTASAVDPTLSAPMMSPPTEQPFAPTQTPVVPFNEPAPLPSPASVNQGVEGETASPLVRVLYIGGAAIFFIVYTYFWMRVFNLQLPF